MRSGWMRGLLDAEAKVVEVGVSVTLEYYFYNTQAYVWYSDDTPSCGERRDYWSGFADYLHNYELRNGEGEV
jgi:hypothetical protein